MKKLICLLLAIVLTMSLCACVSVGDPVNDKTPVSGDEQTGNEGQGGELDVADTSAAAQADVTISEQVIYEENGIRVTAKELANDPIWGPSIKVLVENDSQQDVTVQTRDMSINGLMVDGIFSCDVAAGKKANDSISFMASDLETAGITTIKDIEFKLNICDSATYMDVAASDVITITTTADPAYVQTFNTEGFVAYEDDSFKIVVQKMNSSDSFWGADLYVYIENNSQSDVIVQSRDVSVNGFMINPIFSSDITAGKKAYDTITFMESDLTDNGITDITELEIKFQIMNADSWDNIVETEAITVTFN